MSHPPRFLFPILFLTFLTSASAQWTNHQPADLVLGHSDFVTNTIGRGAAGLYAATDVEIDPVSGKLFVADIANHRILRWPSIASLTSGMAAEAVLGQTNFDTTSASLARNRMNFPTAIAIDMDGRLWVADALNNRVLRFDDASTKPTGADADGVLGQPDFVTKDARLTRNGMNYVRGVAVDRNGTLWVADQSNNRVLRFDNAAAKADGADADGVLGQKDFASSRDTLTQYALRRPRGLLADSEGRLWVAASGYHRVMRFDDAAAKADGADADAVLGQADYLTVTPAAARNRMREPNDIALDATGRLYVCDYSNHRVLMFDNVLAKPNGADADYVLGQSDFTSSVDTALATGLANPWGVTVDNASGTLWVADCGNNRIVRFTSTEPFAWPPAPFLLSRAGYYNTTLYRMDHVGDCPDGRLAKDQSLFLRWQPARWGGALASRNNPSDTTRYELNVMIDSVGASSSKTIIARFPAGTGGSAGDPHIEIPATEVYERIFRPPFPWPMEPDTIVMRVNWFVRAYNSVGSTQSDTAGATRRSNPMPTPALLLSYNRPPYTAPTPATPAHNAMIRDVMATTPPVHIIWTPTRDRNIDEHHRIGGFKVYSPVTNTWIDDPSGRTVDTLTFQWVGTVVHTSPPGKGAAIGSRLVRNTGTLLGFELPNPDIEWIMGGWLPPTTTWADTAVIDWQVYVKDFNQYGDGGAYRNPQEEVTFRYDPDGTLRPDTAKWSRFGCRPHELVSNTYRFTLVRGGTNAIPGVDETTPGFVLSPAYPNPLSPTHPATTIAFTLAVQASVSVVISDILGNTVRSLVRQRMDAGSHRIAWDATNDLGRRVPPGLYVCRIAAGSAAQTRMLSVE